jgi:hypothetical protein
MKMGFFFLVSVLDVIFWSLFSLSLSVSLSLVYVFRISLTPFCVLFCCIFSSSLETRQKKRRRRRIRRRRSQLIILCERLWNLRTMLALSRQ